MKSVEEEEDAPVVAAVGNRFVAVPAVPANEVNRFLSNGWRAPHCKQYSPGNRWELLGNYPVFTVVMLIYHYVERIWIILVTPNFLYNIYYHGYISSR